MLTRLSDNLLKLEQHAGLQKLSRWITKTSHSRDGTGQCNGF